MIRLPIFNLIFFTKDASAPASYVHSLSVHTSTWYPQPPAIHTTQQLYDIRVQHTNAFKGEKVESHLHRSSSLARDEAGLAAHIAGIPQNVIELRSSRY